VSLLYYNLVESEQDIWVMYTNRQSKNRHFLTFLTASVLHQITPWNAEAVKLHLLVEVFIYVAWFESPRA